ncbi:hypothetical protein Taro_035703 [Colocasia esculenta]|uniref:Uncharacterized protein n=1 Tax=Colocasia esculenta TaxID=4460 RepID=A0A843W147_COLES|nr:hypothetical protein [Colocasia esculenta]
MVLLVATPSEITTDRAVATSEGGPSPEKEISPFPDPPWLQHVYKLLTTDWFSREEYEKFWEDLQGKRIHIDAQSASTSKDKIRDVKLTQQSSSSSTIANMGYTYEQVMGRDITRRVCGIGTGPTLKSLWGSRSEQKLRQDNESLKQQIDALVERMNKIESRGNNEESLAGRRVRILNFSGQVVVSDILMSDDNDNVVMGKKLGVRLLQPVFIQGESKLIDALPDV